MGAGRCASSLTRQPQPKQCRHGSSPNFSGPESSISLLPAMNIFKAASAMRVAGATFLSIPNNYYEDLDSRYELDPDLLGSMRENAILYDRDSGGEFFQLYTHAFDERV